MTEKIITINCAETVARIFGSYDANIRQLEQAFGVNIVNRERDDGNAIVITGGSVDGVNQATAAVAYLAKMSDAISDQTVNYVADMIKSGDGGALGELDDSCICVTTRGKPIKAKTVGQRRYVDAIKRNTIVLGVGPAGTGKTFLAVAMAVTALRNKEVSRIILTRPAVEAGERLGYLPGDLQSKIDPYLRPLYDALFEMMGGDNYAKNVEKGVIEIAPLAYMRGRTLDDSFIILDEAQNTTPEQMKMFLTRLGHNSKVVVTGDITQTDLPRGQKSGLVEAVRILADIDDIKIHRLSEKDVVRHKLVQQIVLAYEKHEQGKKFDYRKTPKRGTEK